MKAIEPNVLGKTTYFMFFSVYQEYLQNYLTGQSFFITWVFSGLSANTNDPGAPVSATASGGNVNIFFQFEKYPVATPYFVGSAQAHPAVVFQATANAAALGTDGERGGLAVAGLDEMAFGFAGMGVKTAIKGTVELKIKGVTGGW